MRSIGRRGRRLGGRGLLFGGRLLLLLLLLGGRRLWWCYGCVMCYDLISTQLLHSLCYGTGDERKQKKVVDMLLDVVFWMERIRAMAAHGCMYLV